MKRQIIIILTLCFALNLSFGLSAGWKQKGGIYYYVLYDMTKGSNEVVPFEFQNNLRNFSAITVGKGTGNFDIDVALYDSKDNLKTSDTSPQDIAAVAYTFNPEDKEISCEVSCSSGNGIAVIYAGNTADLLKVLTINYLKQ